jgi:hypothetical protein
MKLNMFCTGVFLKIEGGERRVISYAGLSYTWVNNGKWLKTCRAYFEEVPDVGPTHDQNKCKSSAEVKNEWS